MKMENKKELCGTPIGSGEVSKLETCSEPGLKWLHHNRDIYYSCPTHYYDELSMGLDKYIRDFLPNNWTTGKIKEVRDLVRGYLLEEKERYELFNKGKKETECPGCGDKRYEIALDICKGCEKEYCYSCLGLYHGSENLYCEDCFNKKPETEKEEMKCYGDKCKKCSTEKKANKSNLN